MSDEKRRNARTQSRFDKDGPGRRDKEKSKSSKKSSVTGENNKNESSNSKAAEGFTVEYQENANVSFKHLEDKKYPVELKFDGLHTLSETENGISRLIFDKEFFVPQLADELFEKLRDTTKWYDKNIVIRGEEYPQPRLVAWYGPFPYTYSGATLEAAEMPPTVLDIKERVEAFLQKNQINVELNSVLLNLYRTEKDSVAWHSDDELTMGVCPTIASVSLGCPRKFEMRPKLHTIQNSKLDEDYSCYVNLVPGSLIIMDGCMQKDWQHRVPKEYHDRSPRINLTFRTVYPKDKLPTKRYSEISSANVKKLFEKPCFDADSFPPLTADNKALTNNKAPCDNESSVPTASNCDHQVDSLEHAVDENQNQNNLNKVDSCTLDDASHYNVMEPEKSSDTDATTAYELDVSEKSCKTNSTESATKNVRTLDTTNEGGRKQKHDGKRHSFNINAPDFVPKSVNAAGFATFSPEPNYESYTLYDLSQFVKTIHSMTSDEFDLFSDALFRKTKHFLNFSIRDSYELTTLFELLDEGQSDECRRIIVKRVCAIISKNDYEMSRREYRSPNRHHGNRTSHTGMNYSRSRNFSRSHQH